MDNSKLDTEYASHYRIQIL